MKNIVLVVLITLFHFSPTTAQTNRTIQIHGTAEYNLSPNEIVIQISFEEYFTDENESIESKVRIETLEQEIRKAVEASNISKDKITSGGVIVVRPYKRGVHKKRRLNKSILVCIKNTDQYILLTRKLEETGYFDNVITTFSIVEFRNTDTDSFKKESKSLAYKNAVEKATLILSESGEKLGKVISINEIDTRKISPNDGSFYSVQPSSNGSSGFKPVVVNYELEVVFEILN